MKFIFLFLYLVIVIVNTTKCPESKRAHETNCTFFYNCVNLPNGDFIWIPSKCANGLVFQPYLKECVIPGDIWSCNVPKNGSLSIMNYEIFNLASIAEIPQNMSGIEAISDVINKPLTTLHSPLTVQKISTDKDNIKSFALNHKEKNYLSEYTNNEQIRLSALNESTKLRDRYEWLSRLINRLIMYKNLLASLDQLVPPTAVTSEDKINLSEHSDNIQNTLLNYFVQKYVQRNNNLLTSTIQIQNLSNNKSFQSENMNITAPMQRITNQPDQSNENIVQMFNDDTEFVNGIIMVSDELGNKQYFTIDNYKSVAHRIKSVIVNYIPCIKNIRLPNKTDCTKYYTCDPIEVSVTEFICPQRTAFNEYIKVCDSLTYKTCKRNEFTSRESFPLKSNENNNTTSGNKIKLKKKLCEEIGKAEDPTSNSHYYICYNSSKESMNIKAVRMMCPNKLIFCKAKKICTTKQLCRT